MQKTKEMIHKFDKIISVLVVTGLFVGEVGFLARPKITRAQVINPFAVPAFETGGHLNAVSSVDADATAIWGDITEAAIVAATNSGISYFSRQMESKLTAKLGIRSYRQYQAALVEAKYLIEAYSDYFGDDTVKVGGGSRAKNINELATDAEKDFQGLTAAQARELAARDARSAKTAAQKRAAQQKQIVRASSLFASSVVCGNVDGKALNNMAEYMAGSAVGFTSKDVDPTKGLDFYQKMARMGSPEALPQYWVEGFKDNARQKESEARAASALEVLGPGLKSPQSTDASGKTKINKSLNLVSVGQQNAQAGVINIATGKKYKYDTSSFLNFTKDVTRQQIEFYALAAVNKGLYKLGLVGGPVHTAALALTRALAGSMANTYVTKLYNQVGEMIFQGQFLAEGNGCRKPGRLTNFTDADRTFTSVDFTSEVEPSPGEIIFEVTPSEVEDGEIVNLAWNASSLGSGITVTLSGGGVSGPQGPIGGTSDNPAVTTTYTLTASGPGVSKTASVIVTVVPVGTQTISLNLDPGSIESNRRVSISWNAGEPEEPDDEVLIDPLSEEGLPFTGQMCYAPTAEQIAGQRIDFTMVVPVGVSIITRQASVGVAEPAPRTLEYSADKAEVAVDETATLTWAVTGYPDSVVRMNGDPVATSGAVSVGAGTYNLTIEEANGCGVIEGQSITITQAPAPAP